MREVRLRSVRAAETFGRRTVRDEIQQRLAGRADHRDHLRAGFGRRDGRGSIFVDVAARDDHVQQRRRELRKSFEALRALVATRREARHCRRNQWRKRAARRPFGVSANRSSPISWPRR